MIHEPTGAGSPASNRLAAVPNAVALAAAILAVVAGVHGAAHVLLASASHPQVSTESVLIALWGLTTLAALGGFAVLGRAYTSLVGRLDAEPEADVAILPEDERRILDPILETPGVTQVEVVARSGFSDAKVSQTLKALRERGLVERETQGRTYRLYPGRVLDDAAGEP